MATGRRAVLEGIKHQPYSNVGLWLDKFLSAKADKTGNAEKAGAPEKGALISEVLKGRVPEGYREAYQLRREGFEAQKDTQQEDASVLLLATASADGRLVIGLGAKGVLEAGIRLDHTWGLPFLPGSSLKGLAAAAAHKLLADEDWRKRDREKLTDSEKSKLTSFETLFGTTDSSGMVVFHDAWWVPAGGSKLPLAQDVMTVHHHEYYQHEGNNQPPTPTDMDSPVPVPFITSHGQYFVVLEGKRDWCEAAIDLLEMGLRELGIGAKTNAGYGRMSLKILSEEDQRRFEQRAEERKKREKLEAEAHAQREKLEAEERKRREKLEDERRIIREKLRRLGDARDFRQQAIERVKVLKRATELQIDQQEIVDAARELFRNEPKWWKDWIKKANRTDEERAIFAQFFPTNQPLS